MTYRTSLLTSSSFGKDFVNDFENFLDEFNLNLFPRVLPEHPVYVEDGVVKVDLVVPGLDRESLEVKVTDNVIDVSCYYKLPRTNGLKLSRKYRAVKALDSSKTKLDYADGIVSIAVPYLDRTSNEAQVFKL